MRLLATCRLLQLLSDPLPHTHGPPSAACRAARGRASPLCCGWHCEQRRAGREGTAAAKAWRAGSGTIQPVSVPDNRAAVSRSDPVVLCRATRAAAFNARSVRPGHAPRRRRPGNFDRAASRMKGHGNIGTLTEHMMNSGAPPGEEETHAACARLPTMPRMLVETARMPPVDAGAAAAPRPQPRCAASRMKWRSTHIDARRSASTGAPGATPRDAIVTTGAIACGSIRSRQAPESAAPGVSENP